MQTIEKPAFILIDGSYYCFYRYYSMMNWWKMAHPEEPLENPIMNPIFVEKFKKTFIENIQQIPKKIRIDQTIYTPILIAAKDCKRENIWRNNIYPKYKATRVQEDGFMGGSFFKMVYEEDLFIGAGCKTVLKHSRLEADDCIAVSVKLLLEKYPDCMIYIIASDRDYLQLQSEQVKIYNMVFKNIAELSSSTGNAETDLRIKIIMGDTSDNIPSVFPKCGFKTALKCCKEQEFFEKKMQGKKEYYDVYNLNEQLISFSKIPSHLESEFIQLNPFVNFTDATTI